MARRDTAGLELLLLLLLLGVAESTGKAIRTPLAAAGAAARPGVRRRRVDCASRPPLPGVAGAQTCDPAPLLLLLLLLPPCPLTAVAPAASESADDHAASASAMATSVTTTRTTMATFSACQHANNNEPADRIAS
jgi:hypothetical protein